MKHYRHPLPDSFVVVLFLAFTIPLILLSPSTSSAEYFTYIFTGKWNNTDPSIVLEPYDYQDIQNLRRDGDRITGVGGHTALNLIPWSDTYKYASNGFHFQKTSPSSESHIIIRAASSSGDDYRLYQNIYAVPGTGNFSTTVLHTDATGAVDGRFSNAPRGFMAYTNGKESLLWGGDEFFPVCVYAGASAAGDSLDGYIDKSLDALNVDDSMDMEISVPDFNYVIIGAQVPLTGLKFYVSSANTSDSDMVVKEYQGSAWTTLSTTDNTDTGPTLGQTGTVTWTATDLAEKKYMNGYVLYWYQVHIDAGSADVYGITATADPVSIPNTWSGEEAVIAKAHTYLSGVSKDVTDELNDYTIATHADLDGATSSDYLYLGFVEPQQGVILRMYAVNTNAAVLDVEYKGPSGWTSVSDLVDNTAVGGIGLGKSGELLWTQPAEGDNTPNVEVGGAQLYYYRVSWATSLSDPVQIYYATGIPSTYPLRQYAFPVMFQGRLFLMGEAGGRSEKVVYSAYNQPWTFNGSDSSELYIGHGEELIAAVPLYNVYNSTGFRQLIVTSKSSVFRLQGTGPSDWEVYKMSEPRGCVAPLSMTTCGVMTLPDESRSRNVVMWVGATGVYACDGATVQEVSHDIRSYWNPNHDNYIAPATLAGAVGWYDHNLNSYKLLIGDLELEYSLTYRTWTKLYRENATGPNPLAAGFPAQDANGAMYSYGATDEGKVYRLEYGVDWNSLSPISQYIHTKDLFLTEEAPGSHPFFMSTTIDHTRLLFKDKGSSPDTISFTHYCNGVASDGTTDGGSVPSSVRMGAGPMYTGGCWLGPCSYHSMKISTETDEPDGMELQGLGFVFDSETALQD